MTKAVKNWRYEEFWGLNMISNWTNECWNHGAELVGGGMGVNK